MASHGVAGLCALPLFAQCAELAVARGAAETNGRVAEVGALGHSARVAASQQVCRSAGVQHSVATTSVGCAGPTAVALPAKNRCRFSGSSYGRGDSSTGSPAPP